MSAHNGADAIGPGNDPERAAPTDEGPTAPPATGGIVDGMTTTEPAAPAPEQLHAVITGPEVHAAGTHAETVAYRLPFGGRLVVRLVQDKRNPHRFRAEHDEKFCEGPRDGVLAWIEQRAQFLADRETRRRAGSTVAADHAAPPSNVPGRDLWLHLHECRDRAVRENPARGRTLPDQQVTMIHATNIVGCLPWEERLDGRSPRPDLTDEQYRAAYRMYQQAWARIDDTQREW